ncbi:MAG: hypothetical protein ACOC6G_01825, partial [Thermoproteota archaeon]
MIRVKSNIPVAPPHFLKEQIEHTEIEVYRNQKLKAPLDSLSPMGLRLFYSDELFIHKCHFILDAHLQIEDTKDKRIIEFNRMYELVRNPLNYFLAFLQMQLLDKDFAFIHGASVTKKDKTLLFPAFSDTGKTTTALLFLKDGWRILGDDMVLTDGKKIWAYPIP